MQGNVDRKDQVLYNEANVYMEKSDIVIWAIDRDFNRTYTSYTKFVCCTIYRRNHYWCIFNMGKARVDKKCFPVFG